MNQKPSINRREFIGTFAATAATISIVPNHVLGGTKHIAPSDKLNVAGIGVGGMGKNYLYNALSENIVAICDVDEERYHGVYERFAKKLTPDELQRLKKNLRHYQDYRLLLEKEPEIDAVMIGTPDHTHALVAMECIRRKKHVYLAKPMTRTVGECRTIIQAARKQNIITQVSMQANASEDHRLLCEWIWDGVIGDVHEVHTWTNRPVWPQGLERPKEIPSVPPRLNWNFWLGPAPFRPYHPAYHPFDWHGWYDFGTGALGDMGSHHFDPIFKALKLIAPINVQASSTKRYPETYPKASVVHYDFPARKNFPPVRITWYSGSFPKVIYNPDNV